ncbi:MAG: asparagine synthase (glutamine-hydrolyzing), partial [Gemmatimonadetes bacterium]|nr:asparagine synthase (glutamine-hydrolyzing) [Gemmatimonadota bacterium]
MCGICGFAAPAGVEPLRKAQFLAMRESMTHRGPDDAGLLLRGQVGLAHRRLSIVDVAAGRQPMVTRDGRYAISYNGEVYNHLDIRRDLSAAGVGFETKCDTEAVLQLCAARWTDGISRLNGMFAFAVWDEGKRRLLLARDRLGIKPLYYVHREDGALYFASEIKAFVASGVIRPSLYFAALPDFLANHATTGETTLFEGVRRLLPGHTLEWKDGRVTTRSYWDLPLRLGNDAGPETRQLAEFEEALSASVEARLMADVPLGVFLSGGIDSAAITSLVAELRGPGVSTFSVAFAEREANELEYARAVARKFKTDHTEVVVSPEDFFRVLPKLVWHEDTPLAHPSSVPLHFVSRLASERVKVVLSGEGSDELLGGYGRYWKTLVNHRLGQAYDRATPELLRRWVRTRVSGMGSGMLRNKLSRTFLAHGSGMRELYFDNFSVFSSAAQARLLTDSARARVGTLDPYGGLMAHLDARPDDDWFHRILYADLKSYLHELLMKQDQMSMSA